MIDLLDKIKCKVVKMRQQCDNFESLYKYNVDRFRVDYINTPGERLRCKISSCNNFRH